MNLTKVEKAAIIILVVGGILAAGIFLFFVPAYNKIGTEQANLDRLKVEQQELEVELSREATIDDEIKQAKTDAEKLEGGFYPDLTTYEAVEVTLAHLKECGLETHSISATPLSTRDLSLEVYLDTPVVYNLKTYSQGAREKDEDALAEGQFKDKNKVYTVTASGINDIIITDEEGKEIEKKNYTETMLRAYKEALCAVAVTSGTSQTVGVTSVSFEVTGRYEDYLKFIDYIFDLERATYMSKVVIPMTIQLEGEALKDQMFIDEAGNIVSGSEAPSGAEAICEDDTEITQTIDLYYFSVEQMEELETIDAAGEKIVVNQ